MGQIGDGRSTLEIDIRERQIEIYRSGGEVEFLTHPIHLSGKSLT
ncbi:hypothetical protein [Oxynema sp. CENA135]|jgi:hypothetical protein|nr:hypothetical protein [Oxynema sp. CENA135]